MRHTVCTRAIVRITIITLLSVTTGWARGEPESELTKPRAKSHPLGRLLPDTPQPPRIVIKDDECLIDDPVVAGERIVLTTVGIERTEDQENVFQPFVSIAIDQTFTEAGQGPWLAVWNLGRKPPGWLSRLRATIPGFRASKRVQEKELERIEEQVEDFTSAWAQGRVKVPSPYLDATHLYRRSTISLVLGGIARALDMVNVLYPAQLMFRNFLIHRHDYHERAFQQTYVGLSWYNDLSQTTPETEQLSADAIQEIKFRLLANRKALGRWVDEQMRDELVFAFENQMRDHLWGTSCFLAGAANEYHLGYEEIQRITTSGVPLALGGILYYDAKLAPAPEQVKWSRSNPFDLTYNPFTDPEVQRAAQQQPDGRVPLALYVYQSNHALKPIIVVDFFRPDNPRARESGRYWRRLTNEAIAASDIGFFYTTANRVANFAANRKTSSRYSEKGPALGIEELRLSLQGYLYFEPDMADSLLDQIDRRVVNPLVQPARVQRARAELHYQALLADGGRAVVQTARRVREELIRALVNKRQGALTASDYEAYRRWLRKRPYLRRLQTYLNDTHAAGVLTEHLREALSVLAHEADRYDQPVMTVLWQFRQHLEKQFREREQAGRPIDWDLNGLIAQTDATLTRLYQAAGKTDADARYEIARMTQQWRKEDAAAFARQQKKQAEKFARELKQNMDFLQRFAQSGANLTKFSPWYVMRALNFLRDVPQMSDGNPAIAKAYRQWEGSIQQLLNQVAQRLEAYQPPAEPAWLQEHKLTCQESLRQVQALLLATSEQRASTLDEQPRAHASTAGQP